MSRSYTTPTTHISYWKFFKQHYAPLLQEVDLLLKTMEAPVSPSTAAKTLFLQTSDIEEIMATHKIKQLDRIGLLNVIMHGKSPLCRMLQRECLCGSPKAYSPAVIAYIYGLQERNVASTCLSKGYSDEVPSHALPDILDQIYVYIVN